jgi:hypothetical protein
MPCSPLKINWRFGRTCHLHLQGRRISEARNQREESSKLVSCLAYSSTLKLETTCSPETSVDFQRTTRHFIPEDKTLHNYRCENLRSYLFKIYLNTVFPVKVKPFLFRISDYTYECISRIIVLGLTVLLWSSLLRNFLRSTLTFSRLHPGILLSSLFRHPQSTFLASGERRPFTLINYLVKL